MTRPATARDKSGSAWRIAVDRGGTFTDVVAVDGQGHVVVQKVLSSDAEGEDATVAALRLVAGADLDGVESVRMGTTVATNALLQRRGAKVALVVTEGFRDLLEIGTQARPELFSLRIEKPAPLASHVEEVTRTPSRADLAGALQRARAAGSDAVVISLIHGWRDDAAERDAATIAGELGFETVVVSHDCDRRPGYLARTQTAVAEAYVTPSLRRHVRRVVDAVPATDLRFMTSSGGLASADRFRGRDALLSGPAGGAVAVAEIARRAGCDRAIGLDMGGTSTDACRTGPEGVDRASERPVAGITLRASMVDVVTVAAGGGSILAREGGRLVAGPASAGAVPGPACYRAGGPPTVTDANVVLGRVRPELFPRCFGASRDQPIDPEASRAALARLGAELGLSAEECALAAVRVANEAMARALRQVSVARGHDPAEHALVAFGGAAPQHACALAALLGMRRVLVPRLAGVLSAWGIGLAPVRVHASRAVTTQDWEAHEADLDDLSRRVVADLAAEGVAPEAATFTRWVEMRHEGVEAAFMIPVVAGGGVGWRVKDAREMHEREHERMFGFRRNGLRAVVTAVHVEAVGRGASLLPTTGHDAPGPRPGDTIRGPSIIALDTTTIVIDEGWAGTVLEDGTVDLAPTEAVRRSAPAQRAARLQVMGSRFMGIAEQMGETLRRTAKSPNIRERLDFSCALFTKDARLVANAPHVPVHLGAMGETVRAILAARGESGLSPGMAIVSNDPHRGGSHLPDITVVTPVFDASRLAFFVASRGHHADVGGIVPGSMPPFARTLAEEGVVLHDVTLVESGRVNEDAIRTLMSAGPHPVRGIGDRLADLRAQAAANATGARLLLELCGEIGSDEVERGMRDVIADAADATRELLASLPQGTHRFEDSMDEDARGEGARIACAVTIGGRHATFDFTGTSDQVATSLNAPRAVVRACVLYALRCLLGRDVPLNDGVLEPVDIVVPSGTILSPLPGAAVCGGNVETSMRVADVLLAALGAQAASQGTMNNLTLGDATFALYETIGGGAGAGPSFDGASAVHSHLTNTRLTDAEILEMRAPVRVLETSVRRGSGGAGRHRGGDGMIRRIQALVPLEGALLTERRSRAPFGLEGGSPGERGRNVLMRGRLREDLGGKATFRMDAGDIIVIETPGGGGWGKE